MGRLKDSWGGGGGGVGQPLRQLHFDFGEHGLKLICALPAFCV